jgi:hypothetical protein
MAGTMDFKPTFQCEKLEGKFFRMVMHIEEEVRDVGPLKNKQIISRKIVPHREEFNEGYMIYFPQGHSMFVAADDIEQLQRIGVLEQPQVVDMNSGELVPAQFAMSLKEVVEAKTKVKYRPRATGGVATLEGGEIE